MLIIAKYFIWFVFYSMLGWFWETTLYFISKRKFIDKSFLKGPFCPVYGIGAVLLIILLGSVKNIFILFAAGALISIMVEYISTYYLEVFFRHKEWDYSKRRFNLYGRVCLLGAFIFGLFAVLLVRLIHPVINFITGCIPPYLLMISAFILLLVQIIDFYITFTEFVKSKI